MKYFTAMSIFFISLLAFSETTTSKIPAELKDMENLFIKGGGDKYDGVESAFLQALCETTGTKKVERYALINWETPCANPSYVCTRGSTTRLYISNDSNAPWEFFGFNTTTPTGPRSKLFAGSFLNKLTYILIDGVANGTVEIEKVRNYTPDRLEEELYKFSDSLLTTAPKPLHCHSFKTWLLKPKSLR